MLKYFFLAFLALGGCEGRPEGAANSSDRAPSRELLRHKGSVKDARPLESVTGPLQFADGCWTTASGPNRIALYFPREAELLESGEIRISASVLREGEVYKFLGDLAETGVDAPSACNGLPSSMAVGDAWPAGAGGEGGSR